MNINELIFLIEFLVKFLLVIMLFFGSSYILLKGIKKAEAKGTKYFNAGIAAFGYMYAFTRIFFLVTDFYVFFVLGGTESLGDPMYLIFWKLASISSLIALIFFEIVLETYLVKTKYIFTGLAILATILVVILPISLARIVVNPVMILLLGHVIGLYLYVAVKSSGEVRNKAIYCIIGIGLLAAGVLIDGSFMINIFGLDTGFIGGILMNIGLGMYFLTNY